LRFSSTARKTHKVKLYYKLVLRDTEGVNGGDEKKRKQS